MRDRASVEAAYAAARARFGRVDVLVNNAGVWIEKPVLDFTDEEWALTLDTNVTGDLALLARRPARDARAAGGAHREPRVDRRAEGLRAPRPAGAAKAAVIGLTRALAKECWQDGIAVNAICPAEVDKSVEWGDEPKERPGAPSVKLLPADVARAAVFLASADAEAVTGTTLDVYGIGFLAS